MPKPHPKRCGMAEILLQKTGATRSCHCRRSCLETGMDCRKVIARRVAFIFLSTHYFVVQHLRSGAKWVDMHASFKKISQILVFSSLFLVLSTSVASARSGCCSHHGGVCGCGCCDGSSLSDTCAPYYPECNGGSAQEPATIAEPEPAAATKQAYSPVSPPSVAFMPSSTLKPTPSPTPEPSPSLSPSPPPFPTIKPTPTPKDTTETAKEGILLLGLRS